MPELQVKGTLQVRVVLTDETRAMLQFELVGENGEVLHKYDEHVVQVGEALSINLPIAKQLIIMD